jgi:type III secretory pathway component EscU
MIETRKENEMERPISIQDIRELILATGKQLQAPTPQNLAEILGNMLQVQMLTLSAVEAVAASHEELVRRITRVDETTTSPESLN